MSKYFFCQYMGACRTVLAIALLTVIVSGCGHQSAVYYEGGPDDPAGGRMSGAIWVRGPESVLSGTETRVRFSDTQAAQWSDEAYGYLRGGEWLEAVRMATAAINKDPELPEAYANRAWAYIEMGLYAEALDDCRQAVSLNPDLGAAYNNMGVAYQRQGLYAEASKNYRQACRAGLEIGCKNFGSLKKYADSLIEESAGFFKQQNFDMVIEKADQALKIDPDVPQAYINKAGAYLKMGRLDDAGASIRRAIALDPENGMAYNNLAVLQELQGDASKAGLNYQIGCKLGCELACKNSTVLNRKHSN